MIAINLLNREEYYADIFDKIIIVSPTVKIDKSSQLYFREEVEDLYEIHDDVENVNEIIQSIIERQEEFDVNDPDNLPPRLCLVLDDISGALKRDALVAHIFSRYRHYNLTIFLSNQTIKTLPTVCRSMATAVFLSSCYSTVEREKVLEEWAEFYGNKHKMIAMWNDAVKERFNYLYLKLDDVKPRAFQIGSLGLFEFDRIGRQPVVRSTVCPATVLQRGADTRGSRRQHAATCTCCHTDQSLGPYASNCASLSLWWYRYCK